MDANPASDVLRFERFGEHVALVTLDRPDKRNAINSALAQALEAAVDHIEADPALRVAVLAANGPVFCAGADLAEISAGRGSALSTERGGFGGFVRAPRGKPWIAAVAGTAFGGGCELALACELVVAGEGAQFGLPEVKRGLLAAAGGAFRIVRALPRAVAMDIALTGRPLAATEALQYGMINRIAPDDEVIACALALAETIAANAPLSVQATFKLARLAGELDENALWGLNGEETRRVMSSDDAREGPRAFLEKRAPRWSGR